MNLVYPFVILLYLAGFCIIAALLAALWVLAYRRKWRVVRSMTLLVGCAFLVFVFIIVSAPPEMDRGYPFLHEPPYPPQLAGSYALTPQALNRLRERGEGDSGSRLVLNADGTFQAASVHPSWPWLAEGGTERFSGSGTWGVQKPVGGESWAVFCDFRAADREGERKVGERSMGLWIAAKTKARPEYALGIGLNSGDEGYLVFAREKP
jgi:hypothetical protein